MSEVIPPLNVTRLNARLADVAAELRIPVTCARVMLCTLIVSQMLADAVTVTGGMGVKLRFGEHGTRATSDLDVSTRARGVRSKAANVTSVVLSEYLKRIRFVPVLSASF